ncbi:hypothetical protein [Actinomadura sp. 21ATH]|uniref:hypothetical protein n=1 Tax=Actinomadura sp. 21ATH TaxID=1735444 RepID=UPI0035BF65B4
MGLPVLGATPAQAAESTVSAPKNGSVIRSGSSVTAKAYSAWIFKTEMRAVIPGSGDTFLTKRDIGAGNLSATIPLRRNGKYEVYIKKGIGGVEARSTFTVKIPPAQPSGVSAKASGGKLTVSWNLGLEDDISGYTVSAGSAGSKSGSAGSLCSGTSCKATFSVPASASGTVPISVRAKRPDGLGGSVSSGAAATSASVGSGSTGSGGGGTGSLPGSPPPNGTAPLTPFNDRSPVTLPSVQPDGATPGFTYPAPQVANQANPKAENASAVDSLQWGRSVGIALVLLVVAAHLGTWTRKLRVAQSGVSVQGKAARTARGGSGRARVRRAREHIARAEAVAKTSEIVRPAGLAGAKKAGPAKAAPSKDAPKGARKAGEPAAARRRPATLGRSRDGVDVRIADPKGRHADGRGRRRK